MKRELMLALLGDEQLVSLVGRVENSDIPCIFFNTPLSLNTFPAVSFFEKDGGDAVFADDVCIARTVVMQVDIWAEERLSDVFDRVDYVMRSVGYDCNGVCDIPDPNIRHMRMVYEKLV